MNNKFLNIDYFSDIHLNSYFKYFSLNQVTEMLLKDSEEDKDVLIIAGDISEYNSSTILLLENLSKFYKKIFFVLGNHDLYLEYDERVKYQHNFKNRIKEIKSYFSKNKKISLLHGKTIIYKGVKFSGSMAWYDDSYIKVNNFNVKHKNIKPKLMNDFWKKSIKDFRFLCSLKNYITLFKSEYKKLEKILDTDIMITHINPSPLKRHQTPLYVKSAVTTFFCFDGRELLKQTTAKYWFFGHTHNELNNKLYGVEMLCNPVGYYTERTDFKIKRLKYEYKEKNVN